MAPKKEAAPPEPTEEAVVELDPWETQEVVCGLVSELVDGALAEVKETERKAALVPFVVEDILQTTRQCIAVYFLDHDIGEPSLDTAPNWTAGEEPIPAPVDSWSRGAIQLCTSLPAETDGEEGLAEEAASSALRSTGSRLQSPRARTPSGAPGSAPGKGDTAADARAPILIAKPKPDYVNPNAGKKTAPIVTASERLKKRLDNEAKEEVLRLERLKADLKGREYTYDARGNVIVMEDMHPGGWEPHGAIFTEAASFALHLTAPLPSSRLRTACALLTSSRPPALCAFCALADKLPAFQQQPRLALTQGGPRKKKGGHGAGGKGSGARIDFGGAATFKQLDSLQPPLMESMKVQAGVLLKQGEASKGGDPRQFDGERITREQFEQLANMSGGFSPRRPVADAAKAPADPLGGGGGSDAPASPAKAPPTAALGQGAPPAMRPGFMPNSPQPGDNMGQRNAQTRERGGMPTKTRLPPPSLGATTGHGQQLPYPPSPDGLKSGSDVGRPGGKAR